MVGEYMINTLINFFSNHWDIISWAILGPTILFLLYLNYTVASHCDQELLIKYGSWDKVPEDEKYPPVGW
jgi:hypothetical protein